ncbi:uncharacterized protein LOC126745997 [Anthonomus grandis grandis]|uniref:uncharacterized protein LOC126745997 n=1 Tax=Anthonomus grandis grandis TaxID=2921223 RepID=UPI0021658EA1|nr:uncharacterized protein LOC126745997 [Anthonomus grandis grandis]
MFTSDQETPLQPISNDSDYEHDTEEEISDNEAEHINEEISSPRSTGIDESEDTNTVPTPLMSPQPAVLASNSRCSSRTSTNLAKCSAPKRKLTEQHDMIEKVCSTILRNGIADEFHVIGENVAYKLRRINEEQRFYAEQIINKVLFYAIQNKLTPDSDVVVNKPVFSYQTIQKPVSNKSYYQQNSNVIQHQQLYQFSKPLHTVTNNTPFSHSNVAFSDQPTVLSSAGQIKEELSDLIILK